MKNLAYISLVLLLFSCGNIQRVDTTKIKKLMKSHEIKKITEADINNKINELGNKLVEESKNVSDCKTNLFQGIDLNNSSNIKNLKAQEIIEAYQYSFKNQEELSSNIQKLNDTLFLFTFPIDKKSAFYKNCNMQLGLKYYSLKEILTTTK